MFAGTWLRPDFKRWLARSQSSWVHSIFDVGVKDLHPPPATFLVCTIAGPLNARMEPSDKNIYFQAPIGVK